MTSLQDSERGTDGHELEHATLWMAVLALLNEQEANAPSAADRTYWRTFIRDLERVGLSVEGSRQSASHGGEQ